MDKFAKIVVVEKRTRVTEQHTRTIYLKRRLQTGSQSQPEDAAKQIEQQKRIDIYA